MVYKLYFVQKQIFFFNIISYEFQSTHIIVSNSSIFLFLYVPMNCSVVAPNIFSVTIIPTFTVAHPLLILTVCPQTQKHPEYTGPALGPKMAEANKREFTEDQLRASEGHLNLQMGFNKGASQSGLGSFGNSRHM